MIFVIFRKRKLVDSYRVGIMIFSVLGIILAVTYIFVVVFSRSFVDAAIPFDERMLSPVYIFVTATMFAIVLLFTSAVHKKWVWLVFVGCVLFSIRSNMPELINRTINYHKDGIGYNSTSWTNSSTLRIIKSISINRLVYSNGSDVVKFKTGINAITIPSKESPNSTVENLDYLQNLVIMCEKVKSGEAILVYLDGITWRWYLPTEEEIVSECSLPVLRNNNDGTIYGNKNQ